MRSSCRCGYEFCYKCGIEWKKGQGECPSGCLLFDDDDDTDDDSDDDEYYDDSSDDDDNDYYDDSSDDDDDDDGGSGGDNNHNDDDDGSKYSSEAGFGLFNYSDFVDQQIQMMLSKKD